MRLIPKVQVARVLGGRLFRRTSLMAAVSDIEMRWNVVGGGCAESRVSVLVVWRRREGCMARVEPGQEKEGEASRAQTTPGTLGDGGEEWESSHSSRTSRAEQRMSHEL